MEILVTLVLLFFVFLAIYNVGFCIYAAILMSKKPKRAKINSKKCKNKRKNAK